MTVLVALAVTEGRTLIDARQGHEEKVVKEELAGPSSNDSVLVKWDERSKKTGRSPRGMKRQWEELLDSPCVCVMGSLFSRLEEVFESEPDAKALPQALLEVDCSRYRPLGEALVTSENVWPSPAKEPSREYVPDNEGGPKTVGEDMLLDMLENTYPGNVPGLELKEAGKVLALNQIKPKDAGVYTCHAMVDNSDKKETIQAKFNHKVVVVKLPKIVIKVDATYKIEGGCDERITDSVNRLIAPALRSEICPRNYGMNRCHLAGYQTSCVARDVDHSVIKLKWQLEAGPALYVSERLMDRPEIQLALDIKAVLELKDSLIEAASMTVHVATGRKFLPEVPLNGMYPEFVMSCDGGYGLNEDGFCVPCGVDKYSVEGDTHCKECPVGEFQPVLASSFCKTRRRTTDSEGEAPHKGSCQCQ